MRQGPVTLDELKSMAAREELRRSDLLWTEGMTTWQSAGSITEGFQGLPPDLEPALSAHTPPCTAMPPPLPTETKPPQSDSPFIWYFHVLKNYAVFDGRARRREFWSFFFVNMGISIVLSLVDCVIGGPGVLNGVYSFGVLIPMFAAGARRMHDTGRNGWWQLLPIANFIYWAEDGKPGSNQFGTNPKTGTP